MRPQSAFPNGLVVDPRFLGDRRQLWRGGHHDCSGITGATTENSLTAVMFSLPAGRIFGGSHGSEGRGDASGVPAGNLPGLRVASTVEDTNRPRLGDPLPCVLWPIEVVLTNRTDVRIARIHSQLKREGVRARGRFREAVRANH